MQKTTLSYKSTGKFSGLTADFLADDDKIRCFFGNYPSINGFEKQVSLKKSFSQDFRNILVDRLLNQYKNVKLSAEERVATEGRILLLADKNTFTVTTGHQLCLFTGPLYSVYKILHVAKLAEKLSATLTNCTVLPIFWMATEDHDFEEVNHIFYEDHKLVWQAKSGDGVGRISTAGIDEVIEKLQALLPEGQLKTSILADLKASYLQHGNLADATRQLVHNWFGKYGVLVIDGDDAALKAAMIPAFRQELLTQKSAEMVASTSARVAENYGVQVAGRDINLFYLRDGQRSRIVHQDQKFHVLDTALHFTEAEIVKELENHPERFSPNVLLRPLYQETILPNLGYIGGGGEVAYWAQLKDMFNAFGVVFPIVILRQSFALIPKKISRKQQKLHLSMQDLFMTYNTLKRKIVASEIDVTQQIAPFLKKIETNFDALANEAAAIDHSLMPHVLAQKTALQHKLAAIEKKMWRAAATKETEKLRMLQEILASFAPSGGLQERRQNIIEMLFNFGPTLLDTLYQSIHPLDFEFIVLTEE